MLSIQELDNYLKSNGADYEILEHDKPILTTQDAKQYFDTDRAAPVLVVQTERGLILLIVSARRGRLDFKELAAKLGFAKMKLADRKKAEKAAGYPAEVMPLIGISLPCIFDTSLLELDYIYGGSGDELHTLKIAPKDVERLNQVEFRID